MSFLEVLYLCLVVGLVVTNILAERGRKKEYARKVDADAKKIQLLEEEVALLREQGMRPDGLLHLPDISVYKYADKEYMEIMDSYMRIDDYAKKFGEVLWDFIQDDDISSLGMAEGALNTLTECQSDREFVKAEEMLLSICGNNIATIHEEIKRRDEKGYSWECL